MIYTILAAFSNCMALGILNWTLDLGVQTNYLIAIGLILTVVTHNQKMSLPNRSGINITYKDQD